MRRLPLLNGLGERLPPNGPPRSIVSLVPSMSELVAEWGLAPLLLAVTDYCVLPHGAFPDAERIRGTKNPDTSRITALRPHLVLADQEENRQIDVARLRADGIAVWVTSVRSVRDVAASVRSLGLALGCSEAGEALARRIIVELDVLSTSDYQLPSACIIWRDGPQHGDAERWWAVGADTFAGDLLRRAGLPPVAVGDDGRYPCATLAEFRGASPEVVLLPDEPYSFGDADADEFRDWAVDVLRCSGQPLFWWGPRTPAALRWLRQVRADRVARGQDSVRRAKPRSA